MRAPAAARVAVAYDSEFDDLQREGDVFVGTITFKVGRAPRGALRGVAVLVGGSERAGPLRVVAELEVV